MLYLFRLADTVADSTLGCWFDGCHGVFEFLLRFLFPHVTWGYALPV